MTVERLESKRAIVGDGFEIRRALPNRHRRLIGAWCFLDHAGPADYPSGGGLVVGPHPHIGLQTFTWMIEGSIQHTDSLGYRQLIRPGQVNLMTAGSGVCHSEESISEAMHLAQLWIALPDSRRGGRRMLTISTPGSCPPPTRSGNDSRRYFPATAFVQLSRLGVALPNTTTAPSFRARTTATSRA